MAAVWAYEWRFYERRRWSLFPFFSLPYFIEARFEGIWPTVLMNQSMNHTRIWMNKNTSSFIVWLPIFLFSFCCPQEHSINKNDLLAFIVWNILCNTIRIQKSITVKAKATAISVPTKILIIVIVILYMKEIQLSYQTPPNEFQINYFNLCCKEFQLILIYSRA